VFLVSLSHLLKVKRWFSVAHMVHNFVLKCVTLAARSPAPTSPTHFCIWPCRYPLECRLFACKGRYCIVQLLMLAVVRGERHVVDWSIKGVAPYLMVSRMFAKCNTLLLNDVVRSLNNIVKSNPRCLVYST